MATATDTPMETAIELTLRALPALGALFAYPGGGFDTAGIADPGGGFDAAFRAAEDASAAAPPEVGRPLAEFLARARALAPSELEEVYTRTFDLNPVCALEVGWHLYGEAYERGNFLVSMRGLLRRAGIDEGGELPDHLSLALAALGRLAPEEGGRLAKGFVLPALDRMLAGIAGKDIPYEPLLQAARAASDRLARAAGGDHG